MNNSIWIQDPNVLLEKPFDFFPDTLDSFNTKMNSIMRLSIYTSILLSLFYSDFRYLGIIIVTGIVIFGLNYNNEKHKESLENIKENARTVPTKDNPMMNFTTADLLNTDDNGTIKEKPPIVDPLKPENAKEITNRLHDDIYRDVTDVFDKKLNDRQFYTVPNTDIVNDRETWAKWCYNTPASCKEDSICYKYEDLRANRPEFPIKKEVEKL